jgi:hypothetical protein
MKPIIRQVGVVLFLGISLNSFAQQSELSKSNINQWIDERLPLFITGTSSEVKDGNNVPAFFSSIAPTLSNWEVESNKKITTVSSVALIQKNEIIMAPVGARMSIYPIAIFNDSIIICTRNPKQGTEYANIKAYDINEFVLFTLTAIELGEISDYPFELSKSFISRHFYTLRNQIDFSTYDLSGIRCFIKDIINNYIWTDEFVRNDYQEKYINIFSTFLSDENQMERPESLNSIFVDYEAKLGEYSFESNSFPITFGKIDFVSNSLQGYYHNIEFEFGGKEITIPKDRLNPGRTNPSEYNYIESFQIPTQSYEYWNYNTYKLPVPTNKARELANRLNENRIIRIRIFLDPMSKPIQVKNKLCSERGIFETVTFVFNSYMIM